MLELLESSVHVFWVFFSELCLILFSFDDDAVWNDTLYLVSPFMYFNMLVAYLYRSYCFDISSMLLSVIAVKESCLGEVKA